MEDSRVKERIQELIEMDIHNITNDVCNMKDWYQTAKIEPYKINLFTDFNYIEKKDFWVITDPEDPHCAVVYSEEDDCFGLYDKMLEKGELLDVMTGLFGPFSEAVNAI